MEANLFFLFFLVVLNSIRVVGQDTIFTVKGDTIIADISDVDFNSITYTDWGKNFAKTISRSKVSDVVRQGEDKNLIEAGQCVWAENRTDEFTGHKILFTGIQPVFASISRSVSLGFRKINDFYFVEMKFTLFGSEYLSIHKDDQLMLKLINDTIIKLNPVDHYTSESVYYGSNSTTIISAKYFITQDELKLLSQIAVAKVRFYTTDGYYEETCNKEKNVELTKINANCMLDASVSVEQNQAGEQQPTIQGSIADELIKLKKLLDEGAITQEEYNILKEKLIKQ